MALTLVEVFGHTLDSPKLGDAVRSAVCPFIESVCVKRQLGFPSGACTASLASSGPVIFCPVRLYAEDYKILREVANAAFGPGPFFLKPGQLPPDDAKTLVIPFGNRMGGEIRIGMRSAKFAIDWILAHVDRDGALLSFVPVEVQSVDTTGSYQKQVWDVHRAHQSPHIAARQQPLPASGGFNWENVNKRILPQLISKSHAVRGEPRCTKGLFFICPTPIFARIFQRLGGETRTYTMQPGSITFHHYGVDLTSLDDPKPLILNGQFTTTTEQVITAFTGAVGLPEPGVYENATAKAVKSRLG